MKKNDRFSERGQAVILIVLAIIVLMAFVSLAIDGGSIYSARRTSQNAADAAAYAGAGNIAKTVKNSTQKSFNCGMINTVEAAAIQAAQDTASTNKYTIDASMTHNNGVEIICNPGSNPSVDVHVRITSAAQTSFMQFVNNGQVVNTVDSVVRIYPKFLVGEGESIIALKDVCGNYYPDQYDGGIEFSGSFGVKFNQGGAHSNNCIRVNGSGGGIEGTGGMTYTDPPGTYIKNGSEPVNVPVNPTGSKVDVSAYVQWLTAKLQAECDSRPNSGKLTGKPGAGTTANPGKYTDIDMTGANAILKLNPGLYCVTGSVTVNGGTFTGNNVTFFVYPSGGDFDTTGGPIVNLTAPAADCGDPLTISCSNAVGGVLMLYLPDDNKKTSKGVPPQVSLGGNATSTYGGTVFAPNTQIQFGGDNKFDDIPALGAQLIGETIRIHGNTDIAINYKASNLPNWPAKLTLQK